jgi:F-type H+-transporting ATPase subunit delta
MNGTSPYTRALLKEALSPWLDDIRAANRAMREEAAKSGGDLKDSNLVKKLPNNTRPVIKKLFQLMAREGHLNQVNDLVAELERMFTEEGQVHVAQVMSAVELVAEDRQKLETSLRARFGQDLLFEYQVDPNLLGGLRVRVGDQVIDGTVASRLNAMRERILG